MEPITIITKPVETEEVTFSFSEAASAIGRVLDSYMSEITDFAHRISEAIKETVETLEATVEAITSNMYFGIRRLTDSLMEFLMELWYSLKHATTSTESAFFEKGVDVYRLTAISIIVRTLTLGYLEHCCLFRMIQLLRHQGRGSADSVSENDNLRNEMKSKANWFPQLSFKEGSPLWIL